MAFFAACEQPEQNLGTPDIDLSITEMTFESAGGDKTLDVTATREWKAEPEVDWVVVSPESGSASAEAQTVTVSVLENTGLDREASVKFTIGMKSKYLTVSQAGPGGSVEALVVYANDMDNGKVQKVIGSDGKEHWPYLDQSNAWRNEMGFGIDNLDYAYKGVSVRSVSSTNNIWFPASGGSYFSIRNLELGSTTSMQLTFDCIHGSNNGHKKEFAPEKFKVFLSQDNAKWVELPYELVVKADDEFDSALAKFTLSGTDKLSIAFQFLGAEDGYRLTNINLSIYAGDDATAVDFSKATEMDFGAGSTGGNPGTGDLPEGTGEGTEASPYDAAKATRLAAALGQDDKITGVYVKGIVKSIKEVSTQYGNATYYITDADGAANFYVYRGKNVGNTAFTSSDQIKAGDNVVIYGDLMNYMGNSPQLGQGNYLVSINGEGDNPGSGDQGGNDPTPPSGGSAMTIAEILASSGTFAEGTTIEGVVISNRALNNLTSKKGLYVQDSTGGLQFYLEANHEFDFGDKVIVDLSGSSVGDYNGAVQISGLALEKITKISSGNTVTPKTVSVADFMANKYEGQYVAIEGVQVADSDLGKTFVEGGSHTSINVVTADGKSFAIFSSKYASYGESKVPQGSGTLKGISSISKGAMQIIFAQDSDYAGLTGTRFDGTTPPDDGGDDDDDDSTITPPADGDYEPGITWTLGDNAYDNTKTGNNCQTGTVNGEQVSNILKLGTGSKTGNATLHVPAGTKKLGFYCVAWKGKTAQLKFSTGGSEIATIEPAANTGATGNAPYASITLTDSDYFEVNMPSTAAADVKVETLDPANGRVLIIGIKAIAE